MTDNIKLPPLPEWCKRYLAAPQQAWVSAYARQAVAEALASLQHATPQDEWPTDADYALGHLAGCAFGTTPADEIGHCVAMIREALAGREGADTARLAWLLPNLHPANFGLDFPGGYEWADDVEFLDKWRAAIDGGPQWGHAWSCRSLEPGMPAPLPDE